MAPSSAFYFERKCLRNLCISIGFWHLTWILLNWREMVILHVECNLVYLYNTKKRNNVGAFDFSLLFWKRFWYSSAAVGGIQYLAMKQFLRLHWVFLTSDICLFVDYAETNLQTSINSDCRDVYWLFIQLKSSFYKNHLISLF